MSILGGRVARSYGRSTTAVEPVNQGNGRDLSEARGEVGGRDSKPVYGREIGIELVAHAVFQDRDEAVSKERQSPKKDESRVAKAITIEMVR